MHTHAGQPLPSLYALYYHTMHILAVVHVLYPVINCAYHICCTIVLAAKYPYSPKIASLDTFLLIPCNVPPVSPTSHFVAKCTSLIELHAQNIISPPNIILWFSYANNKQYFGKVMFSHDYS